MKLTVAQMKLFTFFCPIFLLCSCAKQYHGIDELTPKAGKELPISDAATVDLQYAGMCTADDKALIWFISDNEYQAHYYLPMEVKITGTDRYSFVQTYKPILGQVQDIAVLNWNRGFAFVINNPDCASVKITDENGIHEEKIDPESYPYVFYEPMVPSEYLFLDSNGNELN